MNRNVPMDRSSWLTFLLEELGHKPKLSDTTRFIQYLENLDKLSEDLGSKPTEKLRHPAHDVDMKVV